MFVQLQVWSLYLLQNDAVGWDPVHLWSQMGALAKAVVIGLFIMSAYSIGVMIDRVMAYNAARKQSRQFAPAVAGALREGKLDEAVKIADRYKKSHLAKVVVAGLQRLGSLMQFPCQRGGPSAAFSFRGRAADAELVAGADGGAVLEMNLDHLLAVDLAEAIVTTAIGLFVAIPAVWMFNYFTGKIESFDVEMGNSSSELIDYFLKRSQRGAGARK